MKKSLFRADKDFAEIYDRQFNMVYRICFSFLKNKEETEDAVQETFLRLLKCDNKFNDFMHEQAWLIRVAQNICKDHLKTKWNQRVPYEEYMKQEYNDFPIYNETLDAVLRLPNKYKSAIYLFYYEGHGCKEISQMLHIPNATVRFRLHQGRKILKQMLGSDFDEK